MLNMFALGEFDLEGDWGNRYEAHEECCEIFTEHPPNPDLKYHYLEKCASDGPQSGYQSANHHDSKSCVRVSEKQHNKPYKCLLEGCSQAFFQKQHLDRHRQSRHKKIDRYYHCTTEGCKYSSTSKRAKQILREDHLKDHSRQCGHYGPHSPTEREKGSRENIIGVTVLILFEEWKLNDNSEKQRTLRTATLGTLKAPLFYPNVIDENYIAEMNNPRIGFYCEQPQCYFSSLNLHPLAFKLQADLVMHERRTFHHSLEHISETQPVVYEYFNAKGVHRDLNTSLPPSQAKTTSKSAQDVGSDPQTLSGTESREISEVLVRPLTGINPSTIEKASFFGAEAYLGPLAETDDFFSWPQDNESICTTTQRSHDLYPCAHQPSSVSELYALDTDLAWTGAWDSRNDYDMDRTSRQERLFAIEYASEGSHVSSSSSSISNAAEFFDATIHTPSPQALGFCELLPFWASSLLELEPTGTPIRQSMPLLQHTDDKRQEESFPAKVEHINISKKSAVNPMQELQVDTEKSALRTSCPECHKDFGRSRDMKRHLRTCHEAMVYKCPEERCGREFHRADKLKNHQNRIHNS